MIALGLAILPRGFDVGHQNSRLPVAGILPAQVVKAAHKNPSHHQKERAHRYLPGHQSAAHPAAITLSGSGSRSHQRSGVSAGGA